MYAREEWVRVWKWDRKSFLIGHRMALVLGRNLCWTSKLLPCQQKTANVLHYLRVWPLNWTVRVWIPALPLSSWVTLTSMCLCLICKVQVMVIVSKDCAEDWDDACNPLRTVLSPQYILANTIQNYFTKVGSSTGEHTFFMFRTFRNLGWRQCIIATDSRPSSLPVTPNKFNQIYPQSTPSYS